MKGQAVTGLARYPHVMDEWRTLELVLSGRSLARYGDGELKMAQRAVGIKSQDHHPALQARLQAILQDSGDCLVGIPNIHDVIRHAVSDQKIEHWSKYLSMRSLLADRPYVSAFITRPDSAPWIHDPKYWDALASLWRGRAVTLVRGSGKSLTAERLSDWGAASVTEIAAPRQQAWAEYDALLKRIGTPERCLICLGPTATVMAVDLCRRGVHAVDLGHVGMFFRRYVEGAPVSVTEDDRQAVVA